jgi:hypothetical protein
MFYFFAFFVILCYFECRFLIRRELPLRLIVNFVCFLDISQDLAQGARIRYTFFWVVLWHLSSVFDVFGGLLCVAFAVLDPLNLTCCLCFLYFFVIFLCHFKKGGWHAKCAIWVCRTLLLIVKCEQGVDLFCDFQLWVSFAGCFGWFSGLVAKFGLFPR